MSRLAVAGPSAVVTDAAKVAGEMGGSVADVAIVAALVAMCTEPGVCAPGAGGYFSIGVPGSDPVVIDGYVAAPGIDGSKDPYYRSVTMEYGGGVTTLVDVGSVAVPGSFAACAEASRMFGVLPWRDLMEVVASAVEDGFPMSATAHLYFQDSAEPIFSEDPASRLALFDGDRLRGIGERVHFEGLADTIRYVGQEGADVFYEGDLGVAIADDIQGRGGLLTRQDLAGYEAIVREPLTIELGEWKLVTNPAPAVGGVTLAAALSLMHQSDDPLDGAVWAESLRSAFHSRFDRLEGADDISAEARALLTEIARKSPSTISVSVVDVDGAAAAATFSAGYGSGVIPTGTGLLMNNCLGEIELTPGGMEAQQPGARLLSNMAPTIARSPGQALAVGSPGASRITSALAISVGRVIFAGDELVEAIEYPRVHPEFPDAGDRVAAERGLDLSALRLPIRWFDEHHMYFGGVNGAALLHGELAGHADSRRTGSVALID